MNNSYYSLKQKTKNFLMHTLIFTSLLDGRLAFLPFFEANCLTCTSVNPRTTSSLAGPQHDPEI